ncbi:MAG: hypothetical protein R2795_23130 [Saprospiraceae bacterium]
MKLTSAHHIESPVLEKLPLSVQAYICIENRGVTWKSAPHCGIPQQMPTNCPTVLGVPVSRPVTSLLQRRFSRQPIQHIRQAVWWRIPTTSAWGGLLGG